MKSLTKFNVFPMSWFEFWIVMEYFEKSLLRSIGSFWQVLKILELYGVTYFEEQQIADYEMRRLVKWEETFGECSIRIKLKLFDCIKWSEWKLLNSNGFMTFELTVLFIEIPEYFSWLTLSYWHRICFYSFHFLEMFWISILLRAKEISNISFDLI